MLISYAMQLARIVHWFNPAVWLAMAKMRTDAELACDAAVLKANREDCGGAYGGASQAIVERMIQPVTAGTIGVLHSRRSLTQRIKLIANFRRPSVWASIGGILLLAVVAMIGLTRAADREPVSGANARGRPGKVHVKRVIVGDRRDAATAKQVEADLEVLRP